MKHFKMDQNCITNIQYFPEYTGELKLGQCPYGVVINEMAFGYMLVDMQEKTIEFKSFPFATTPSNKCQDASTLKVDIFSQPDKSVVIELDDFMATVLSDLGRCNFDEHITSIEYESSDGSGMLDGELNVIDFGVLQYGTVPAAWIAGTKVLNQFGIWRYVFDNY